MIMINEQWYQVRDLKDVSKLVREQFSYDLADKMDELVEDIEFDEDYKVIDLLLDISNLEDDVSNKDYEIGELQEKIEELENEVESKDNEIEELNNTIEDLTKKLIIWENMSGR